MTKIIISLCSTSTFGLPGLNIEYMPTKSANNGVLIYIRDTIKYKLRLGFNVEKENELE